MNRRLMSALLAVCIAAVGFTASPIYSSARNPVCLATSAPGTEVYSASVCSVDASNKSEGYITVSYSGGKDKVKLQIMGPNRVKYTYNLMKGHETFPLTAGAGSYEVGVYENISGTKYSCAFKQNISVGSVSEFGPYLYPNQYVKFNKDNYTVAVGAQLAAGCQTDLQVVEAVYNYVVKNMSYDYQKAATVPSGYTSNIDQVLSQGAGICIDYAAVMASMLRSQGIPTRLDVGYAGSAYHAWISTYIQDIGWVNGIIQFNGVSWSIMDPTYAANSSHEALKSFIGNGSNYKVRFIY